MFSSIKAIEHSNRAWAKKNGRISWFDADAMRFFSNRIESEVIGGRYFVASSCYEDGNPEHPRKFTVCRINDDGRVRNASKHQEFDSLVSAERAAVVYSVGKSDLIREMAEKSGTPIVDIVLSTVQPEDFLGIPRVP